LKFFRFRIIAVLAMALLCCGTVWGQKDTGNIAGTVKDSSGALVANTPTFGTPEFGFLTAARDPRQIQFALKLSF
jgi:hypothetical protein